MLAHLSIKPVSEITEIEFIDREGIPLHEGDKVPRFDVFLRALDGRIFHIEVQVSQDKFFLKRSFYYVCNDFLWQSQRGLKYEDFEPVIFIGLFDFNLLKQANEQREWHTIHKVQDIATHEAFFDCVEFHILELPVLRQQWRTFKTKPSTKLERLLFYFGSIGGENMIQELAKEDTTVADFLEREQKFRQDRTLWRRYLFDETAREDYQKNMLAYHEEGWEEGHEKGREEGREEGIEIGLLRGQEIGLVRGEAIGLARGEAIGLAKGREESREELARNLRLLGFLDDEKISLASGLPIEVVKAL